MPRPPRESAADRARRAGKQARDTADEMARRAKPLTEKLVARATEAGRSLRDSAEAFREGLHEDEQPPSEPPRRRPRPGPR
jgi:hypothetical protein